MKIENMPQNNENRRREEIREKMENMANYIDSLSDDEIITMATDMLDDLGLTLDDLKNKKVVDLGSATQIIERAATIKDSGEVLSVDKRDYVLSKRPDVKRGIVADIRQGVPQIADSSIDLLIAHAGPPAISAVSRNKEDFDFSLKEVLRMLKTGGEARISPLFFYFIKEKYKRYEELHQKNPKDWTDDERKEELILVSRIEDESLKYLQGMGLNVVAGKNKRSGWSSYGIIKK